MLIDTVLDGSREVFVTVCETIWLPTSYPPIPPLCSGGEFIVALLVLEVPHYLEEARSFVLLKVRKPSVTG